MTNGDFIIGGMCKSFYVFSNLFMLKTKILVMDQVLSCLQLGNKLYIGLSNETIKIFTTETYEEITTLKIRSSPYVLVKINDNLLGFGGYNAHFQIIDQG